MTPLGRIWACSAAYAVVYFALGADRYLTYHSGADVGLFTQSIATVFQGFANTTEGGSHFIVHFSPILYLCAPLLLVWHSPLALVALQAVAGALVAPPLFLLARRRLPEGLAFGVAATALLYPPLAGVTFADFHENGFAPAATLWLLWAVDARRWLPAAIFLALTLSIKEDQAAIVAAAAVFGIVYFWRKRERAGVAFSVAALAAAVIAFVGFFALVRPLAGAREAWGPLHFYDWIAGGRGSTPWWSIGRPAYFLEALVPLVFVCCCTPFFLVALPGFAECLISHESVTYTMGQHYAAVWIGYVLAAFALGTANVYARAPRTARYLVRIALAFCALNLIFASPTHWGHYLGPRSAHDATLDRALAELPPNIVVGTHDELYAHLGFDPSASLGWQRDPEFLLIDRTFSTSYWVERMTPYLASETAAGRYRIVSSHDGIDLYRRVAGVTD